MLEEYRCFVLVPRCGQRRIIRRPPDRPASQSSAMSKPTCGPPGPPISAYALLTVKSYEISGFPHSFCPFFPYGPRYTPVEWLCIVNSCEYYLDSLLVP